MGPIGQDNPLHLDGPDCEASQIFRAQRGAEMGESFPSSIVVVIMAKVLPNPLAKIGRAADCQNHWRSQSLQGNNCIMYFRGGLDPHAFT